MNHSTTPALTHSLTHSLTLSLPSFLTLNHIHSPIHSPHQGELRYVQMSVERETGKVQIVLVWNAMMFKDAEQTLPRLVKRLKGRPDLWHSVYANFQTSTSNTILNYHPKGSITLLS